ncbi:MAG: UvrB, excinuclease subunit excinuclease subunit [Patescibacteria group bacterium]|nr:UvrB, excinuclease subunit excinuclease subunit [Patescibacteria group bacterium]
MINNKLIIKSDYQPAGDQPEAILALVEGLKKGMRKQTLLGATGTGKTFTMANVIEKIQKPTLVIAHNKTLAAQLAQEFRAFFPDAAVHYFVSYYDYYQPEAYMPMTDTFIEKDAQINEEIDRLRHASTQALLTRSDVIIVASVSCIYGLGSPEEYKEMNFLIRLDMQISKREMMEKLIHIHFGRTNADLKSGQFRAVGNKIDIMPVSEKYMISVTFSGNLVSNISIIDPVTSTILEHPEQIFLFPAKHFLTEGDKKERALVVIEKEMQEQVKMFEKEGKLLEAERIKRRTQNDIAMIRAMGYCSGIENYSRPLSGKPPGSPPETLISYFPHGKNGEPEFLTMIDESHVTLPQLHGMYAGDASRKSTLVDFGFRLPSAKDNRPLKYDEFEKRVGQVIYVSATPSKVELAESEQVVQQIIRPTGLVDPLVEIRAVTPEGDYKGQVQDFINEAENEIKKGGRVLATTLTKKMAEDLSEYLKERKIKSEYLHSDIKTIDRIKIITEFRRGNFDCLVGVNLLREGLDMPEVSFIGILDADKEGFLRSETSLIQTIGRAARNVDGRVILYADNMTGSMERAIGETKRRRDTQLAYNAEHGITPLTIKKKIEDITDQMESQHEKSVYENFMIDSQVFADNPKELIRLKEQEMNDAVADLDFETAALLRDEIAAVREKFDLHDKPKKKVAKTKRIFK